MTTALTSILTSAITSVKEKDIRLDMKEENCHFVKNPIEQLAPMWQQVHWSGKLIIILTPPAFYQLPQWIHYVDLCFHIYIISVHV